MHSQYPEISNVYNDICGDKYKESFSMWSLMKPNFREDPESRSRITVACCIGVE